MERRKPKRFWKKRTKRRVGRQWRMHMNTMVKTCTHHQSTLTTSTCTTITKDTSTDEAT
ncbi:hypothetical protein NC651_015656 [Populus alba x Populus x berolinensis]|nr:hypothetical protein NC651_015656 [Populus alba x Populus x berolinensis]